jgi:hypothetical protein
MNILNKSIHILDKEEEEDNKLRTTHGAKWNRTPSHTLTPTLRQEAAKYKYYFLFASASPLPSINFFAYTRGVRIILPLPFIPFLPLLFNTFTLPSSYISSPLPE